MVSWFRVLRGLHRPHVSFALATLRTLLLLALPFVLLAWFGQPALRVKYRYSGPEDARRYHHCIYLALDGWHDMRPLTHWGTRSCPMVTTFPLDLSRFIFRSAS